MAQTAQTIHFSAKLHRPAGAANAENWTFLRLPQEESDKLPARSMVSVEGTINGFPFQATLEPDGQGGHWLRVKPQLQESASLAIGEMVTLEIAPVAVEPEPEMPDDLRRAFDAAPQKAHETWLATTALARRDWIYWITTGKRAETRMKRIEVAIDKMTKGSRRPCCFDRSGMFDKSLSCPVALDDSV